MVQSGNAAGPYQARGLCAGCEYKLVVYAFEPSTQFLVSVTTSVGVRLLSDGVPAVGEARSEAVAPTLRYFRYFVRTASDVSLVLTPLAGNPSLFARFGMGAVVIGVTIVWQLYRRGKGGSAKKGHRAREAAEAMRGGGRNSPGHSKAMQGMRRALGDDGAAEHLYQSHMRSYTQAGPSGANGRGGDYEDDSDD